LLKQTSLGGKRISVWELMTTGRHLEKKRPMRGTVLRMKEPGRGQTDEGRKSLLNVRLGFIAKAADLGGDVMELKLEKRLKMGGSSGGKEFGGAGGGEVRKIGLRGHKKTKGSRRVQKGSHRSF